MVHAPVHAMPHAQLGFLRERPSAARIAAFTGVIALHAAALALLMLPMAAPEPGPAKLETIPIAWVLPKKPLIIPIAPKLTMRSSRRRPVVSTSQNTTVAGR